MDTYDVELEELEEAEGRFIGTVRAVPGLLVFGGSVGEVLERARAAMAFRAGERAMHAEQIAVVQRQHSARDAHVP